MNLRASCTEPAFKFVGKVVLAHYPNANCQLADNHMLASGSKQILETNHPELETQHLEAKHRQFELPAAFNCSVSKFCTDG
jgi:hypothetical protein